MIQFKRYCLLKNVRLPALVAYQIFFKQLAGAMTIVFQQSINQSAIPDAWRLAHVTPLFKGKNDKTLPASYRPISLTEVACKLLERLIVN